MTFSLAGFNRATGKFETLAAAEVYALLGIGGEITQLTMTLATTAGDQYRLAAQVTDHFLDTDGVDAAASTGEDYKSGTKRYSSVAEVDSVFANNMTSNTAPSPQVASSTSEYSSSYAAWMAFDSDAVSSYFDIANPGTTRPFYLRRRLDTARKVVKYRLIAGADGAPSDWTFRGSNDESSWTTLDTRTSQSLSTSSPTEYTIATPGVYLYYEILVSAGASYASIRDLSFTVRAVPSDVSLRSIAYTATVAPSSADLWVLATSTASPGTTLRGYLTRDGATTWTEGTLSAYFTVGGFTLFRAENVSLAAQPSGTDVRWRVDSAAGIEIDAVSLKWRN